MVSAWLYGNQDTSIWESSVDGGSSFELAIACEPLADCAIDAVSFYRIATGSGNAPTKIKVWDYSTATLLLTVDTLADNGEVGWQITELVDPLAITLHQKLWLTAVWPAGSERGLYIRDNGYPSPYRLSLPDPPAGLGAPLSGYHYVNGEGLPNVFDETFLTGVDARFTTATPGGGGSMLAETDFTTAIKWVQEADYYLVTITSSPQTPYERDADGVVISRLIGSWSPLEGDYAGQRFQMDYKQMKLVLPAGQHMTGVSVALLQGAEAHIEAWSL